MLARRVRSVPESLTLALSARARALKAKGFDVVSFAAGELDFPLPDVVRAAIVDATNRGETKYTDSNGTPELRAAIAAKLENENGIRYDARDVIVSCGAKHSIYNAVQVLCDPGDEVLIPSPFWLSYTEIARLAEAEPKLVACDPRTFKLAPEALERAIGPKTRVFVLNSPGNPTGAVYTREELAALGAVLERHPQVTVISDEIYEKIVYEGARHHSIAAVAPALRDRTITVNGLSKTFAMTGLRIGYAAGPAEVMAAIGRLQSHSTSNPTSVAQAGALAAMKADPVWLEGWVEELGRRRALMVEGLRAMRGVSLVAPMGAFYCFASMEGLIGQDVAGARVAGAMDLSEVVLEKSCVVIVPGDPFGSARHFRLSFAMGREAIAKGLEKMAQVLR